MKHQKILLEKELEICTNSGIATKNAMKCMVNMPISQTMFAWRWPMIGKRPLMILIRFLGDSLDQRNQKDLRLLSALLGHKFLEME